jgi:hypothetical protein
MKHIALVLVLLMVTVSIAEAAQTAILKGIVCGTDKNRTGIQEVDIDDLTMKWSYQDGYQKGTDPVSMCYGTPRNSDGNDWCMVVGPEWGTIQVALIGVADIFNLLPESTIANSDDILSATLKIRQRGPVGGEILGVYRVTTPWLVQAAGSNETVANAIYALPGGENPYWSADTGKTMAVGTAYDETAGEWYTYEDWSAFVGFSAADYTTAGSQSFTITDTTFNNPNEVDITDIVKGWYDESNQGLAILFENDYWSNSNAPYFQCSERGGGSWDAAPGGSSPGEELIITYMPEPTTIGLLAIGGVAALIRRKR